MKKVFWILVSVMLPFTSEAYDGEISQSGSCGATDADCHYDLYTDGHLEISGSGAMTDWDYHTGNESPWEKGNRGQVKSVNIDGITKIGQWAFLWSTELTDVKISDTVTEIAHGAFESLRKNIETLVIPSSVDTIGTWVFANSVINNIVLEGEPALDEYAFIHTKNSIIYCPKGFDCTDKGNGQDGSIVEYEKKAGVYIANDKNYFSLVDMASQTNECLKPLNECKKDVLKNMGICNAVECDALINADDNGRILRYKGNTYSSIDALLKGQYEEPHRIYTVDEANKIAGKKNKVMIRYK